MHFLHLPFSRCENSSSVLSFRLLSHSHVSSQCRLPSLPDPVKQTSFKHPEQKRLFRSQIKIPQGRVSHDMQIMCSEIVPPRARISTNHAHREIRHFARLMKIALKSRSVVVALEIKQNLNRCGFQFIFYSPSLPLLYPSHAHSPFSLHVSSVVC